MSYTLLTSETVYPSSVSYQLITLTGNISLVWSSSGVSGSIVAGFNDVSSDQAGRVITLPDARLGSIGTDIIFNNISGFTFDIHTNDGIFLFAVLSGTTRDFKLTNNTTAAGVWLNIPFAGGVAGITSFTIESSNDSVLVTNGIINIPGGKVTLELNDSIANIKSVNDTGIAIIKSKAPLTWGTATLTAGSNITIANGDGILANPNISLTDTVAGLTSFQVGSFTIAGGTIAATAIDTDLKFTTTGTGKLNLNGLTITPDGIISGSFNNAYIPKAWCVFSDGTFGSSNAITIQDSSNITSVSGSAGYYQINFTNKMANINYGVSISIGSAGTPTGTSEPPVVYSGFYTTRNVNYVIVSIVDAAGELVSSLPNGATVIIMSSV